MEDLIHPEKDEDRAKNPEWLVMLGVYALIWDACL